MVVKELLSSAKEFFKNSICENTNDTYKYGWKYWLEMADWLKLDPLLSAPPSYWVKSSYIFNFGTSCFLMFLCFLSTMKMLSPGTITNYVSAVRYHLSMANVDTSYLDTSPYIKKVKVGMWNMYRKKNPVVTTKTLPLSCDMFLYGCKYVFNKADRFHFAIRTALAVMRSCLLRASETVFRPKTDHHLLSDDIVFEIQKNGTIFYRPSYQVADIFLHELTGVAINVRSAKNDKHGIGHNMPFNKSSYNDQGYCLTNYMFEWSKFANLKTNEPFFTCNSNWMLSYKQLNYAHKSIARHLGFDSKLFSCKSSRIGGACALSLAGFPDSYIMKAGRWASLAFLIYVRQCIKAFSEGLRAICNPSIFTMDDVRKLIPSNFSM